MSSFLLNLGHFVHGYAKHNWQLAITTAIQVSGLRNFPHVASNSQQLDLLTSRDIWVTRGESLRISIHILLHGKNFIEAPAAAEVLETIGPVLRDAEVQLWSQLRLLPSLSLPTISGRTPSGQIGDIVLTLAHVEPSRPAPGYVKRRRHYTANLSPARPPDGVPSAGLESVNITLDLSIGRSRSRTKSVERLEGPAGIIRSDLLALNDGFLNLEQEDCFQPMTSNQELYSDDGYRDRGCASQPRYPASDDEMLDDPSYTFINRFATSDCLEIPSTEEHDTSVARLRGLQIGSKVTNDGGAEPPLIADDSDIQRLLELIDTALRTLICGKPIGTTAGIKVLSAPSRPRLADISPTLFSPGYLSAVSQRTPMISKIAYAMKSMQRWLASSTLEAKLASLELLPLSPLVAIDEPIELMVHAGHSITAVVKARLWRIVQKRLYNPNAARRLKPIKPEGRIVVLQEPDEMLDGISIPSLETEFESLFEDEDKHDLFAELDLETPEQYSEDNDILREYDDPDEEMLGHGKDLEDWWRRCQEMSGEDCISDEDREMLDDISPTYTLNHANQQLPHPFRYSAHGQESSNLVDAGNYPTSEDDDMLLTADHVPYLDEAVFSSDLPPYDHEPGTPPTTQDDDDDDDNLLFADELNTHKSGLPPANDDDDDLLFQQERCFGTICWDASKDTQKNHNNRADEDDEMMLT
ncbi:MAG: hypothetical protein M1830_003029 [Pleopsidium flavum]|nr:MAG: hypothetical protein M1830_003029 [Pleopsidium flavum]